MAKIPNMILVHGAWSHVAMLSHPQETAHLLIEAASR
jgi:hypothetical protein